MTTLSDTPGSPTPDDAPEGTGAAPANTPTGKSGEKGGSKKAGNPPSRIPKALPVALAGLVERLALPGLRRRGFNSTTLIEHWPDIVGPDLARLCTPLKLTYPGRSRKDGTLHVSAPGGAAVTLLQPQTGNLIRKVNAWMGAGVVTRVQVHQGAQTRPLPPIPATRPASKKNTSPHPAGASNTSASNASAPPAKRSLDDVLDALGAAIARRNPPANGGPE